MKADCCSTKAVLFGVVVAIWTWFYDFVVHGMLLVDLYLANASLWRPLEQVQQMWLACLLYHVAMGMLVAAGYLCWRRHVTIGAVGTAECPYRKSLRFGLWVGLLLGVPQLMAHVWLPLDIDLPLGWAMAELVKWTVAGLLLAKLYQWKGQGVA